MAGQDDALPSVAECGGTFLDSLCGANVSVSQSEGFQQRSDILTLFLSVADNLVDIQAMSSLGFE